MFFVSRVLTRFAVVVLFRGRCVCVCMHDICGFCPNLEVKLFNIFLLCVGHNLDRENQLSNFVYCFWFFVIYASDGMQSLFIYILVIFEWPLQAIYSTNMRYKNSKCFVGFHSFKFFFLSFSQFQLDFVRANQKKKRRSELGLIKVQLKWNIRLLDCVVLALCYCKWPRFDHKRMRLMKQSRCIYIYGDVITTHTLTKSLTI